jgi:hypothetical protein
MNDIYATDKKGHPTFFRLLLLVVLTIFLAEIIIMLFFSDFTWTSVSLRRSLSDAFLLVLFTFPTLYLKCYGSHIHRRSGF